MRPRFVTLALVVHGAAFLALGPARPTSFSPPWSPPTSGAAPEPYELDLETLPAQPVGPVAPTSGGTGAPPPSDVPPLRPRADSRAARAAEVDDAFVSMAPSPSASAAGASSATREGDARDLVPRGPVDLGLARAGARPGPMILAPDVAPMPGGAAQRAILSALDAHDTELGVGPGGVVARVTRDWIHASLAPNRGEATFEATTDARGIAVDVRLLDADAELGAWSDLSRVLLRELKKNPLRVHPGSSGTRVVFHVRSRVRFPSGSPENGNGVGVQGLGIGGAFDVTDIGAHPSRQVDVFVVSETRI